MPNRLNKTGHELSVRKYNKADGSIMYLLKFYDDIETILDFTNADGKFNLRLDKAEKKLYFIPAESGHGVKVSNIKTTQVCGINNFTKYIPEGLYDFRKSLVNGLYYISGDEACDFDGVPLNGIKLGTNHKSHIVNADSITKTSNSAHEVIDLEEIVESIIESENESMPIKEEVSKEVTTNNAEKIVITALLAQLEAHCNPDETGKATLTVIKSLLLS